MTARVDARGVLCPVPIIRLARVARDLPAGSLVEVLSDDPAAEHDIPAWCRLRGHEVLSSGPLPAPGPPMAGVEPGAAEPDVPNPQPGQPRRHLIRLGPTPPGATAG